MEQPLVTIVVVPRERFSGSRRSLKSIYRNTQYPFRLVYVDGNSPPALRRFLTRQSVVHGFRRIRTERFLSPNQARNLGWQAVDTRYVVFIDNDVVVGKGWLEPLIRCAEETGAWAVAPLYFQGNPREEIIHMAGGEAHITEAQGVRQLRDRHFFAGRPYREVRDEIRRASVETIEFHCALLRNELKETLGALDENLLSAYEHTDLALLIRQAGGTLYVEPQSRVTYTFGLLDRFDVEFAATRWSDEWNENSTRHFMKKWGLSEESGWAEARMAWCKKHRARILDDRRNLRTMAKRAGSRVARRLLGDRVYAGLRNAIQT